MTTATNIAYSGQPHPGKPATTSTGLRKEFPDSGGQGSWQASRLSR